MKSRKQKRRPLELPISHDIYRTIYTKACVAGGIYSFVLAALYFVFHSMPIFGLNFLIAGLSFILIRLLIRKQTHSFVRFKLFFFTISFGVIIADFFQDGGIYSPSIFLLVPISIMLLILTSKKTKQRLSISLILLVFLLFFIQYIFPSVIITGNQSQLLIERLITLIISLFFSTYLITTILEQHILEKNRALESEELKSKFLATMSHMIRTPLNSINGFADFLIDDDLSKTEKQFYQKRITENTQTLGLLINNLVRLSIIQNNSLKLHQAEFSLTGFIDKLESKANTLISKSGRDIHFIIKIPIEVNQIQLFTDDNLLSEALWNIIQNGIRFTAKGSVQMNISIIDEIKGIHIDIIDTGIGIKEEQLKLLFVLMNKQRDSFSTEDDKSPGLGLNISHGIIRALDGKIAVQSKYEEGTQVSIDIPKCILQ